MKTVNTRIPSNDDSLANILLIELGDGLLGLERMELNRVVDELDAEDIEVVDLEYLKVLDLLLELNPLVQYKVELVSLDLLS